MTERLFFIFKNLFKTHRCPIQERLKTKFKPITNRFSQFVVYSAAFYNWDDQGVSDQEIQETIQEYVFTSKVFFDRRNKTLTNNQTSENIDSSTRKSYNRNSNKLIENDWEAVLVQDHYQVWRKKLDKSGVYRYKVFGSFHDIPAKTFFDVQMDTEYRKKWDSLTLKLNILDKEKEQEQISSRKSLNQVKFFDTGNEVLQWVMKYPYPMYSREYCYIRRAIVCSKENLIVLISKSCDHPKCIDLSDRNSVRVLDYESQMVIRPHKSFDENGFDYFLTYFDDPRAYVPVSAYNYIASSGLPGFVETLHQAALALNKKSNEDDLKKNLNLNKDDVKKNSNLDKDDVKENDGQMSNLDSSDSLNHKKNTSNQTHKSNSSASSNRDNDSTRYRAFN